MEWLINRRRMMFNKALPPEYLLFEDAQVEKLCSYFWGDVEAVTGDYVAQGTISGDDDTQVFTDYIFLNTTGIGAHSGKPAIAARTCQYRIELTVQGSTGEPWDIANPSATTNEIFAIKRNDGYDCRNSSNYSGSVVTAADWETQSTLVKDGNKWVIEFNASKTNWYIRLAIRATASTTISWKVYSIGTTYVPVGVTIPQLGAVTSTSLAFARKPMITKFNEFRYFTGLTGPGGFDYCYSLTELTVPPATASCSEFPHIQQYAGTGDLVIPEGYTIIGDGFALYSIPNVSAIILPSTLTSISSSIGKGPAGTSYIVIFKATTVPTARTNVFYMANSLAGFYVPDDSVEDYKTATNYTAGASKIKGFSQLAIDHPDYYAEYITQ